MVFPTPGTSSTRVWPRLSKATTPSRMASSFPMITRPTLATMRSMVSACSRLTVDSTIVDGDVVNLRVLSKSGGCDDGFDVGFSIGPESYLLVQS